MAPFELLHFRTYGGKEPAHRVGRSHRSYQRLAFAKRDNLFDRILHTQPVGGALQRRSASGRFRLPEPGIVITREHIANALERRRFDLISERDLAEWATILLINDAYVLDPADEDLIAEWLNDISANLGAD